MDLSKFTTSIESEEDGVWVQIDEVASVKVARMNNSKYRKCLAKETKPYTQALRTGTISDTVAEKIMARVLARTILLDWKGITENDNDFPYTEENAIRLLTDPKLKDFKQMVIGFSEDQSFYREEYLKESEKN